MAKTTEEIATTLEALGTNINGVWGEDRPLSEAIGGWNMPPVSKHDLIRRSKRLAERIRALTAEDLTKELNQILAAIPARVTWMQGNLIPQLGGGNGQVVVSNLEAFFSSIEQALPLPKNLNWEDIEDAELIPKNLAKRIRSLEASIGRLEPRAGNLAEKIGTIEEAHAAAESLPTDLAALSEATEEVKAKAADAAKAQSATAESEKGAGEALVRIQEHEAAAKQLVTNCESAYSAATTVGLAASFSERARKLGWSMAIWVAILIAALTIAGGLGFYRLQAIQELLKRTNTDVQHLWLNFAMSVFTIGAPIWLAWVSTRQISQRFRLAEDYAFKASVARAYEGYRREAARLDPGLEARLFASALDRLEEAPLRFVATEEHSTPYQELLASPGFHRALDKFPELRQSLSDLLGRIRAGKGTEITPEASAP